MANRILANYLGEGHMLTHPIQGTVVRVVPNEREIEVVVDRPNGERITYLARHDEHVMVERHPPEGRNINPRQLRYRKGFKGL